MPSIEKLKHILAVSKRQLTFISSFSKRRRSLALGRVSMPVILSSTPPSHVLKGRLSLAYEKM